MTPEEREEALERREANAALLSAKLEKDRVALESEIAASAAASKAASAINRALQSDAAKKVKALEAETAQWESKLSRLKAEAGKLAPVAPAKREDESPAEKAAVAAAKAQLEKDLAALEAEKAEFAQEKAAAQAKLKAEAQALADLRSKLVSIRSELEASVKAREAEVRKKEASLETERGKLQAGVDSLMRAEKQQSEQRTKLESQVAAQAAKEVMFEERSRQLQERLKNFAKA
jgi:colicin import membrane protein